MFTGIVSDVGKLVENSGGDQRTLVIATAYDMANVDMGASIACNGICLTVIAKTSGTFTVQASAETLDKTTLGDWNVGAPVNLERALRIGDELGGHLVVGHVDGIARIVSIRLEDESKRFVFEAPHDLSRFIAPKGSITLDGVALTINEVDGPQFGVNIIPHTQKVTTFGSYREGMRVNLEIDLLARYVARFLATQ